MERNSNWDPEQLKYLFFNWSGSVYKNKTISTRLDRSYEECQAKFLEMEVEASQKQKEAEQKEPTSEELDLKATDIEGLLLQMGSLHSAQSRVYNEFVERVYDVDHTVCADVLAVLLKNRYCAPKGYFRRVFDAVCGRDKTKVAVDDIIATIQNEYIIVKKHN
jgi:hypothetical protein